MGKAKSKRPISRKPAKKRLPWFAWLLIALGVAGAAAFIRIGPISWHHADLAGNGTAAIIDQLFSSQPNPQFIAEVTKELVDYGFEVDLYQGENVTVELYRHLPTYGYKLIIFRAHSGLVGEDGQKVERTVVFTNEGYTESRYALEQVYGQLTRGGACPGCPMMFGITAEFVRPQSIFGQGTDMKGSFDGTVVIMMGCSGLFLTDMAEAFIDKGASLYLAWDRSVDLGYVDQATSYLIKQLCSRRLTIGEAVDNTMAAIGADPKYGAELTYYYKLGSHNRDKTLEELIK